MVPIKYRFIFSDLLLFHKIFYKKCNIDLPEYYVKYSDEDRKRLRSSIKPPDYFGGNKQTINLEALRKAKFNELSLKCTLNIIRAKYKTSFFFRATQEWNRLPPDIRILENPEKFEQKLLEHINKQAFCFEIEPD